MIGVGGPGGTCMKYKFENYTLDTERRELRCNGIIQSVEAQVLDLLHFLIKNCDRVVSRENIFQAVWRGRIVSDEVLRLRLGPGFVFVFCRPRPSLASAT